MIVQFAVVNTVVRHYRYATWCLASSDTSPGNQFWVNANEIDTFPGVTKHFLERSSRLGLLSRYRTFLPEKTFKGKRDVLHAIIFAISKVDRKATYSDFGLLHLGPHLLVI